MYYIYICYIYKKTLVRVCHPVTAQVSTNNQMAKCQLICGKNKNNWQVPKISSCITITKLEFDQAKYEHIMQFNISCQVSFFYFEKKVSTTFEYHKQNLHLKHLSNIILGEYENSEHRQFTRMLTQTHKFHQPDSFCYSNKLHSSSTKLPSKNYPTLSD